MQSQEILVSKIIDYFVSGCKKRDELKFGLEVEHFVVDRKSMKSIQYKGEKGIQSLLTELSPRFLQEYRESENLFGLFNEDAALSLEPGSQLEISVKQYQSIIEIKQIYNKYFQIIQEMLEKRGQALITQGYMPVSQAEDIELLPKSRYYFMDAYFKKTGSMGINMMRGTASCQVSIDYVNEADFIDKYQCACMLCPIFELISSNTPVFEGKRNTNPLIRTKIWRNVDAARTGFLRETFDPDFSFLKYAEYILDQNAIYVVLNGIAERSEHKVIDVLKDMEDITQDDLILYLSLVFPNVRLRQYIEIRVADSIPLEKMAAYMALIKGLFADISILKSWLKQFSWSCESILEAQDAIMNNGYDAIVYGKPVNYFINEMNKLALLH
ncbi:MAG: hypothetical protein LBI03_07345, partial [Clostridiales bacterium]|nr:hypothetical protein [Clostridiales bacterium]